ncbi:unnamed protein product [Polarella glacialis]|uniref:Uncharacterized protein n=1 Tax=Polarella glacialis TaxID=89957 RepID=A0A813LTF4_POLGL|nr:unnamed protein product [Polarella glacialis]
MFASTPKRRTWLEVWLQRVVTEAASLGEWSQPLRSFLEGDPDVERCDEEEPTSPEAGDASADIGSEQQQAQQPASSNYGHGWRSYARNLVAPLRKLTAVQEGHRSLNCNSNTNNSNHNNSNNNNNNNNTTSSSSSSSSNNNTNNKNNSRNNTNQEQQQPQQAPLWKLQAEQEISQPLLAADFLQRPVES